MQVCERSGARIAFDDVGRGAPALVLVHGWCCNRSFLAPQRDHFSKRHRVIAPDLPGHGDSDAPEGRGYSIPDFAGDVAWLCRELALERPVVIGHSMGGAIALELAGLHDSVAAAVVLDTSIAASAATHEMWRKLSERFRGDAYRSAARQAIETAYFLPTDDPQRKRSIIEAMLATSQRVMAEGMDSLRTWDWIAPARAARVPVLYVGSSAPRGDAARFAEVCPQLVHGQVVGSGHFLQLEVPDQVNAMIERFLALSGLC